MSQLLSSTTGGAFYVYELIDPRTNKPFYVGKGTGKRVNNHFTEKRDKTTNLFRWNKIQKLLRLGYTRQEIVKIVADDMSEADAYQMEEELIYAYGRIRIEPEGILTNRILDGRPPKHSRQKLYKMRASQSIGWVIVHRDGSIQIFQGWGLRRVSRRLKIAYSTIRTTYQRKKFCLLGLRAYPLPEWLGIDFPLRLGEVS